MRARAVVVRALVLLMGLGALVTLAIDRDRPEASATADVAPTAMATALPNIVLLTSDDQADIELQWMPKTRRLLTRQGVKFSDAISPNPLCCPARASILTGEYSHNTGVLTNKHPTGGYDVFRTVNDGRNLSGNLAVWLQDAGYNTIFTGKMMNGYGTTSERLPGWTFWDAIDYAVYNYFGSRFNGNGSPRVYPKKHVHDALAERSVSYIEKYAGSDKPFFLWTSYVGPHAGDARGPKPVPAARHQAMFRSTVLPTMTKPSFYETDVSDKPAAMRNLLPKLTSDRLIKLFRLRLRTLRSIDEANASIIKAVKRAGELDRTVFVYTSDNGYQLGEHRLIGKNHVYNENLQVPLVIRGPGVPRGQVSTRTAAMIDLAPTFLKYAGLLGQVVASGRTDGQPLQSKLTTSLSADDTVLIESGANLPADVAPAGWRFTGVRTPRYTLARWWTGEEELYDRSADPFELDNLIDPLTGELTDPAYADLRAALQARFDALSDCAGPADCHPTFPPLPHVTG